MRGLGLKIYGLGFEGFGSANFISSIEVVGCNRLRAEDLWCGVNDLGHTLQIGSVTHMDAPYMIYFIQFFDFHARNWALCP